MTPPPATAVADSMTPPPESKDPRFSKANRDIMYVMEGLGPGYLLLLGLCILSVTERRDLIGLLFIPLSPFSF